MVLFSRKKGCVAIFEHENEVDVLPKPFQQA
jgi:hypothetical protein